MTQNINLHDTPLVFNGHTENFGDLPWPVGWAENNRLWNDHVDGDGEDAVQAIQSIVSPRLYKSIGRRIDNLDDIFFFTEKVAFDRDDF